MAERFLPSVPVLSAAEAAALEKRLFANNEREERRAMVRAGSGVAHAVLLDLEEAGGFPEAGRILVLAGKGHNAGDALIAARVLLGDHPKASVDVVFAFGSRVLRPLAARAWRDLAEAGRSRVKAVLPEGLSSRYDVCLDGIFGLQYRPPLPQETVAVIAAAARSRIRLNAAVDLPTGLDEPGAFKADFTYATGSLKAPILASKNAGRLRFIDLGFFADEKPSGEGDRVLVPALLEPLARLRPAGSDKRSQGHVAIVAGSEGYPGAALMAALSASQSGAGLVTACVPERLVAPFAARVPEVIWVGLPARRGGGLLREAFAAIQEGTKRADVLLIGSGLGRDPETLLLARDVASSSSIPLVIDGDALQPDIVRAGAAPRILTPHAGEFKRIAQGKDLRALGTELKAVIIEKGPVTRISSGKTVYHSFAGGPVLSRGGSGDLLAGLVGGLFAQTPKEPLEAACRAAFWHGSAADLLARHQGQTAVRTTQVLDFLALVLRPAKTSSS